MLPVQGIWTAEVLLEAWSYKPGGSKQYHTPLSAHECVGAEQLVWNFCSKFSATRKTVLLPVSCESLSKTPSLFCVWSIFGQGHRTKCPKGHLYTKEPRVLDYNQECSGELSPNEGLTSSWIFCEVSLPPFHPSVPRWG